MLDHLLNVAISGTEGHLSDSAGPLQCFFGLGFVVDDFYALPAAAFVKLEEYWPPSITSVCRHRLAVRYRIQGSRNYGDLNPVSDVAAVAFRTNGL